MIAQRIVNIFHHLDFIYKLTKNYKIERKYFEISQSLTNKVHFDWIIDQSIQSLIAHISQIIKSKKEEFFARSSNEPEKIKDENENFKTPQIFIEQMFQLYRNGLIDDKMLEDQVALMIFGVRHWEHWEFSKLKWNVFFQGNETSALTTSHVILMLAMHPDIQEKAVRELEEIYDDEYEHTDSEKLTKLSYLEMIMKETRKWINVEALIKIFKG